METNTDSRGNSEGQNAHASVPEKVEEARRDEVHHAEAVITFPGEEAEQAKDPMDDDRHGQTEPYTS